MLASDRNSMLTRGLALLEALGTAEAELTLTELAHRTKLPKPTVHRLVTELVAWGGLERSGKRLRLGRRLVALGLVASRERRLRDAADPYLSELWESPRQSVHLGVLDDTGSPSVLILTRLMTKRAGLPCPPVLPTHSTAIGRALLAFGPADPVQLLTTGALARRTSHTLTSHPELLTELARVRRRGVAVCAGETVTGMTGVAVPVFAGAAHAVAAVAVSGKSGHIDVRRVSERLRTVCAELSGELHLRS
jgi:DNA-binding IclR family transcriptional regulator